MRIVERHRHLDRVAPLAHPDREGDHPDRFLPEVGDRPEHGLPFPQAREEGRGRRQTGGPERPALRDDPAVEVGDLNELVESSERGGTGPGRDLMHARMGRVALERRRLRGGQRQDRVIDDLAQHHAPKGPVGAEGGERQQRGQDDHLAQPESGLEAGRPHASACSSCCPNR